MKHVGDITKIRGVDLEPVDVVTGGSPCQDLSVAGLRTIKDTARRKRWSVQRLRSTLGIYKSGDEIKRREIIKAITKGGQSE